MRFLLIVAAAMFCVSGCSKQQYGQCKAPKDHLKVLYKPKVKAHPFSHPFCVVCNTEIEPAQYAAWASEMGAESPAPTDTDKVHPCLYVYTGSETDVGSLAECQSLVCGGTAQYNDMVGKSNGNFNVNPILSKTALVAEEWLVADETTLMTTQPEHHTLESPDESVLQQ